MHICTKSLALSAALILMAGPTLAQEDPIQETGYVNFSLGPAPVYWAGRHEVSLFGCNKEITTREGNWNGAQNLAWNTPNQVLPQVPYGWQQDENGLDYYVSKYYMASPPVFAYDAKDPNAPATIGLVIPDRFTFFGEKPVQRVYLDYSILKPVYLHFVKVDYGYEDGENASCKALKVNLIPLNIQCQDFGWLPQTSEPPLPDGRGAAGIAYLRDEDGYNKVFLPSYQPDGEYLDCSITVLDDIMLYHEVFFVTEEGLSKSLDLTEYYQNHRAEEAIPLACRVREVPPAGCLPPSPGN